MDGSADGHTCSVPTSPARRLRDALEPIAALTFYADPCLDAFARVGLTDFGPRYAWSRSSVLGVAEPEVVAAAFGVWEPGFLREGLRRAHRACNLEQVRDATVRGARAAAREVFTDVDPAELEDVAQRLRCAAEAVDLTARPLYAGHRGWAWPGDPYAGVWRAATLWRELRGDSHLAACIAHGLSGLQATIVTELACGYDLFDYTATRNWSDQEMTAAADALRSRGVLDGDALSAAGQQLRTAVEDATDRAVGPAVTALGDDVAALIDRIDDWSRRVAERGWFPDDPRKRAAG